MQTQRPAQSAPQANEADLIASWLQRNKPTQGPTRYADGCTGKGRAH